MNLDLLKKLTRLANNNPNDNEANLAARKVCKMLEEGNWNLSLSSTNNGNGDKYQVPFRKEPPIQTQQAPRHNDPYSSEYWAKVMEYLHYKQQQADNPFHSGKGSWFDEDYYEPKKPKPEIREIECTQCYKKVETRYVGTPEAYVCNTCTWKKYNEGKQYGY